jgi:hypothetical protein
MDSNNRHKLFPGEIFPVLGEAFVIQRQRKMPHSSIRPGRHPRLRRRTTPSHAISRKAGGDKAILNGAMERWNIELVTSHYGITPCRANQDWRAI